MRCKKAQRIMGKFSIVWGRKCRRPYHPIGQDSKPKVAPNAVDRNFRSEDPLKVVSTDKHLPPIQGRELPLHVRHP